MAVAVGVVPCDALGASSLLHMGTTFGGGMSGGGMGGDSGGGMDGFDVDPSMDPELAMALRISMEEARVSV